MSLIDSAAPIEITAFEWVPDFAQGFVRDLRPRWACEEAGLPYRERLISAVERPDWYFNEQPWGQVPHLRDGDVSLFESGAILLHLGDKDEHLLPRDPQGRANATAWLFAALNSIEPMSFELGNVTIFSADEEWAKLRRPSLEAFITKRLDHLQTALGNREWLAGQFSVADIAMITVLREIRNDGMLGGHPKLAAYVERGVTRPAFIRALEAQLAPFANNAPLPQTEGV